MNNLTNYIQLLKDNCLILDECDISCRKDLIDILCDADGLELICQLQHIDYDVICKELEKYINGAYVGEYGITNYTSTLWCRYNEIIKTDNTLLGLLNCKCKIEILPNSYTMLFVDTNCDIVINCKENAICKVYAYNGAKVTPQSENIKIIRK